jgi:hypothetical protein
MVTAGRRSHAASSLTVSGSRPTSGPRRARRHPPARSGHGRGIHIRGLADIPAGGCVDFRLARAARHRNVLSGRSALQLPGLFDLVHGGFSDQNSNWEFVLPAAFLSPSAPAC